MIRFEKVRSKWIESILLNGIKVLLFLDFKHRYVGPIHGSMLTPSMKKRLQEFQDSIYADLAPYLKSQQQLNIEAELKIDERSYHFWAENKAGEIVGGLRLIPAPFEFSALTPELKAAANKYADIFEISRYATKKNHHVVAQLILFFSGSWIIKETSQKGMLALSKERLKEHYKRYGVLDEDIEGPFTIDWRSEDARYYLVTADIRKIATSIIRRFLLKFKYETR
ncbi:hypothetical protein [Bdellovibrio sp. HCB337]|uniref:hypothetical protein n=1 Tax=Bdellovibrio sp. HCB337 TaxID=3394358 RepID=UPI0039A49BD7